MRLFRAIFDEDLWLSWGYVYPKNLGSNLDPASTDENQNRNKKTCEPTNIEKLSVSALAVKKKLTLAELLPGEITNFNKQSLGKKMKAPLAPCIKKDCSKRNPPVRIPVFLPFP